MDWKTLIIELQQAGISQVDISVRIGKSQAWASAVSSGKYDDLKWRDGQALIALYNEVIGAQTRLSSTNNPPEQPSDDCGRRTVEDRRDDETRRKAA